MGSSQSTRPREEGTAPRLHGETTTTTTTTTPTNGDSSNDHRQNNESENDSSNPADSTPSLVDHSYNSCDDEYFEDEEEESSFEPEEDSSMDDSSSSSHSIDDEDDEATPLDPSIEQQYIMRHQPLQDNSSNNGNPPEADLERFFRELGLVEGAGVHSADQSLAKTDDATVATPTTITTDAENDWFVPDHCKDFEWMGRSLETLVSGHARVAPVLERPSEEEDAAPPRPYNNGGPNVALNLLARETSGKRIDPHNVLPASERLKSMGGSSLYNKLDRPSDGMCSEVAALEAAIDEGDWMKTQAIVSKLAPRLIGDPSTFGNPQSTAAMDDPNLPPTASRFYAGGGRIGLERDAFVLAGGIDVLVRVFREPCFVGMKMARTHDARDLSKELVLTNRLAHCWNEAIACIRELVYSMPSLLESETIFDSDQDDFLPFLFTLLSHDYFFEGAAHLIEEILSIQSHSPQPEEEQQQQQQQQQQSQQQQQPTSPTSNGDARNNNTNNKHSDGNDTRTTNDNNSPLDDETILVHTNELPRARVAAPTTFFLGNVPNLYSLWQGFSCRQLAHFCRILALLIFEPEDRQLLESPAVLKSIELLQLRKNRAARAGRDSTVDRNQSILLGDERLLVRFLDLLGIMNYGPALRRSSPFHLISQFPYIADTLMMLGLHEFDAWEDVKRCDTRARLLLAEQEAMDEREDTHKQLHELGAVAGMLESLTSTFLNNEGGPTNQLGHIIAVISAAQQAGIVVGRPRQALPTRSQSSSRSEIGHDDDDDDDDELEPRRSRSSNGLESLASAAGILTDQMLLRRPDHSRGHNESNASNGGTASTRSRVSTPEDAANVMQFNALLLSPYQVEVLFVLCTLLGGRRKIDAQELLKSNGITRILEEMFQRLPWDSLSPTREPVSQQISDNPSQQPHGSSNSNGDEQYGIHGPGCECTPESALCVQYLRLLHNFCDRDCDNYYGRRLLLSEAEREFIFSDNHNSASLDYDVTNLSPGLLSKIIAAFFGESDESPYRFWLASCVESYLRGSSSVEQVFVARTGLMEHLIKDVTSQRLHCAGSLQTSFDLLGELCKGNVDVLQLLAGYLNTEEKFRKLMNVASSNLVDSNVFIRSLILSLERISCESLFHDATNMNGNSLSNAQEWNSLNHEHARGFLTHSWWDTYVVDAHNSNSNGDSHSPYSGSKNLEGESDRKRPSDWFPTVETLRAHPLETPQPSEREFYESCGRFGWVFKPDDDDSSLGTSAQEPNTIDRLSWFLTTNRTRLLRDLLEVVNLKNINHENICCLNTAVVITIFAYRREELQMLLRNLKQLNEEDASLLKQAKVRMDGGGGGIGNRRDILQNFREVLWFWIEYYTHRGRDRLSLEFSSRLRFQEWMEVVSLLAADDGAPTSLVRRPLSLPQSPYQRISR